MKINEILSRNQSNEKIESKNDISSNEQSNLIKSGIKIRTSDQKLPSTHSSSTQPSSNLSKKTNMLNQEN